MLRVLPGHGADPAGVYLGGGDAEHYIRRGLIGVARGGEELAIGPKWSLGQESPKL